MSLQTKLEPTQKLADALRSLPYKRAWLCFIFPTGLGKDHAYCALGGLGRNFGMSNTRILLHPSKIRDVIKEKLNLTDEDCKQRYNCPHCKVGKTPRKLLNMLPHLNDSHMMNWKDMANTFDLLHNMKAEPLKPFMPFENEFMRKLQTKIINYIRS